MRIYLALGSNIGDRKEQLRNAIAGLNAADVRVARCASLYSTQPREVEDQPWFLNTAIEVRTQLPPQELLQVCLGLERAAGRIRDRSKGPRPVDIDILIYKAEILETPELTIPHPRFRVRRFVLEPMAEIAPDLPDPVCGLTMQQLLDLCPDSGIVERYAPPLL
jgi:2-amino-4-hydroxy-6-hydroxymethyldihydropteridine diphosphokinase